MTLEETSMAEAVMEISSGICAAAGNAISRHGNDPLNDALLAAGFVLAIDKITESIDGTFKKRVLMQLQGGRP